MRHPAFVRHLSPPRVWKASHLSNTPSLWRPCSGGDEHPLELSDDEPFAEVDECSLLGAQHRLLHVTLANPDTYRKWAGG